MLYETTIIIDGYLQEEKQIEIVNRIENIIKGNEGNILKTERMGKRRLSYEIKRKQHGYYIYFLYESRNPKIVNELEREFRFNEGILRYLTVKVDKASPQFKKQMGMEQEEGKEASIPEATRTEEQVRESENVSAKSPESIPVVPESSEEKQPDE